VPINRLTPDDVLRALGLRGDPTVAGHVPCALTLAGVPGRPDRAAHHDAVFRDADFEPNCAALLRILRLLDDRGVRAVLLRTPFHPAYAASRRPRWERRCDEALARVRAAAHPARPVLVWDYMRHPGFADAHFRDDDHLNSAGADRLCSMLADPLATMLAPSDPPTRITGASRGGSIAR